MAKGVTLPTLRVSMPFARVGCQSRGSVTTAWAAAGLQRHPASFGWLAAALLAVLGWNVGANAQTAASTNTVTFGATAVGTAATQIQATFTIGTGGTLGTTQVVTQGGSGQDFTLGTGSTCTGTLAGSATCYVNVAFTPKYPGQRLGGVNLTNASGTVIASAYVSGSGTGPRINYLPATETVVGVGTITQPWGASVDGSGNMYVIDLSTYYMYELTAASGYATATRIASSVSLSGLTNFTIDGVGNIVFGYSNTVKRVLAAGGYTTIQTLYTVSSAAYQLIALDGAGDIFLWDEYRTGFTELLASESYATPHYLATSGTFSTGIGGMAVDSSGNIFFCDGFNYALKEIVAAGGYTTENTIASGGYFRELAIDAVGNIYYSQGSSGGALTELTVASAYATSIILSSNYIGQASAPFAIDGAGNAYFSFYNDAGNNYEAGRLDFSDPPTVTFASTSGSTTTDSAQTATVINNGNVNLAVTGITNTSSKFSLTGSTCTSSTTLAGGSSCGVEVTFQPTSQGTFTDSAVLTDNSLNVAGSQQSIPLVGYQGVQTITFPQPTTPNTSGTTVTLGSTASPSNLAITYTVTGGTGSATISGSQITYTGIGTVQITASQAGNSSWLPATPVVDTVTVKNATTLGLAVSPVNSMQGTSVTVTATLNTTAATGTITIYNYSTGVVAATGSPTSGVFTFTTSSLPAGDTDFSAYYSGDGSYFPSTSSTVTATVGATAVGSTSATQTVTITIGTAGTPSAINVVTGGAAGLDFNYVSGGTCSTSTAYSVGNTCTVQYTFSPTYPGLRMGGVTLTSGTAVLGSAYLSSYGIGPRLNFGSGTVTSYGVGTIGTAYTVKVDGSGNMFVLDVSDYYIYELTAASGYSTVTRLGASASLGNPYTMSIDGNGNVLFTSGNVVKALLAVGGYTATKTLYTASSASYSSMALDGAGDIFLIDSYRTGFTELLVSEGYSTPHYLTTSGSFSSPGAMGVDGSGNIFISDGFNYALKEILAAGGYTTVKTILGNTPTSPYIRTVAVDGVGNVYYGQGASGGLTELTAASEYTTSINISSAQPYYGFAVDGAGNVYSTFSIAGTYYAGRMDLTTPPTLTFASTAEYKTSTSQTVTLVNNGTASLSFPAPVSLGILNPSVAASFTYGTNSTCPSLNSTSSANVLTVGSLCTNVVSFSPVALGTITGTMVDTDNNLNVANAMQTINLSGVGTAPYPTVTGVSPAGGPIAGGTTVTLTGYGFTGTTSVSFGYYSATNIHVISDTSMTVTAPAYYTSGAIDVIATTAVGTGTAAVADQYTYYSAPSVSSVSPTTGPKTAGTLVTITGSNLSGATAVKFGSTAASGFTVVSAASITATAPAGSAGTVDVTVTTPGGTSATNSGDHYTYATVATTTTLTTSATNSSYGSIVTLTATINNTLATGSALFSSGGFALGTGTVTAGVATLTSTGLALGTDSITAVYSGDSSFTGSTSNAVSVTVSIPATNVGTTSSTMSATFSFTSTVTLNATLATAIQVLTQGISGLDFKYVATGVPGACAAGTTYTSGKSCTVSFSFTPAYPGLRMGAVELVSSTNAVVATAYISGVGTGPQVVYGPGTQTTLAAVNGHFNDPLANAIDGAGNIFVADYANGVAKEIVASGGYVTVNTIASGLSYPIGLALDGAGNVFVGAWGSGTVTEILASSGYTTTRTLPNTYSNVTSIGLDGAGNLYTFSSSGNLLQETTAASGYSTVTTLAAANGHFNNAQGIALDASANIFVADEHNGVVKEVTAASGYTAVNTLASTGLQNPDGIALDAAGNVFVTDYYGTGLFEITASSGYTSVTTPITSGYANPQGVSVGGNGNLYISDTVHNAIVKVDYADAPSLTFAATNQGSSTAQQVVTASNDGNATLTLTGLAATTNVNLSGAGTTCTSTTTLASGSSCGLGIEFAPTAGGALTGTVNVTDNTLNATGTVQAIALNGTGNVGTKTITFPQPPSQAAGTTYTLAATASDGDPVTYSITGGTGAGTILGNVVSYIKAGTVIIAANSAATSSYNAAATVSDTVTVTGSSTIYTFPSSNVATTSTSVLVTMTMTTSSTTNSSASTAIQVLTLGATGLDFANASGGTCAASTAYTSGATCTVNVTFTPTATGVRPGAVVLMNFAGVPMATSALIGTGVAPLLSFTKSAGFVLNNGAYLYNFGLDGSGNLYGSTGGSVGRISTAGVATTVANTSGSYIVGALIDGAGNLYYSDEYAGSSGTIYKLTPGGVKTTVSSSAWFCGSAIGPNGTLYFADPGADAVYTLTSSGTFGTLSTGSYSVSPYSVAVDAAGNIYIGDNANIRIIKVTSAGVASQLNVGLAGSAMGLAVDAAGNLYIAEFGEPTLVRFTPAGASTTITLPSSLSASDLYDVKLDGRGNLYLSDTGSSYIDKLTLTTAATTALSSTAVGATGTATTAAAINIGNATLPAFTGTDPSVPTGFGLSAAGTTCPTGTNGLTLAAGATCNYALQYQPVAVGTASGTYTLTDQNLYGLGASQLMPVTGTAATQGTKTITFPQPTTPAALNSTAAMTATASSGEAVTYTITGGTATVSGSNVTYTTTGSVTILASSAASTNYTAATAVSRTVQVVGVPVITWTPSTLKLYSGATIGASVLNAGTTTAGTFAYTATIANGSPVAVTSASSLALGSYTLSANFTPTDGVNNTTATMTQSFTVQNMNPFVVNSSGAVSSDYNNGANASAATSGGGIGAAVDSNGYVWSINTSGSSVSKFTNAGALSVSYSGASISGATALAIDGKGVVWIANGAGTISALTNAGAADVSPPIASAGNLSTPSSISVDAAGSLWVANSGNGTVTEVIGVAAPVVAPVVTAVTNSSMGTRP